MLQYQHTQKSLKNHLPSVSFFQSTVMRRATCSSWFELDNNKEACLCSSMEITADDTHVHKYMFIKQHPDTNTSTARSKQLTDSHYSSTLIKHHLQICTFKSCLLSSSSKTANVSSGGLFSYLIALSALFSFSECCTYMTFLISLCIKPDCNAV